VRGRPRYWGARVRTRARAVPHQSSTRFPVANRCVAASATIDHRPSTADRDDSGDPSPITRLG